MAYFIKVTVAWMFFLLLFEILYKNNGKFTINRVYLLLSIAVGLLLPVISIPVNTSPGIHVAHGLYNTLIHSSYPDKAMPVVHIDKPTTVITNAETHHWDRAKIIIVLYGLGVLALLIRYVIELVKIKLLILRNPIQILYGCKVITTGQAHSPYSFKNYIFLTATTSLSAKELEYVIRHEAAHNSRKHWLDLWISQLLCVLLWFHPLVWRYRYLLRMQQEYEADVIAGNGDPYTYGQFLLQQIFLNKTPSVAHSFYSSPIKNRINMLTKTHGFRSGSWKYLLLAPALMGCTILLAKNAPKIDDALKGNQKVFKGNIFTWRESDTLSYNKQTGEVELVNARTKIKPEVITGMNDEPVYQNDQLEKQATYGKTDTDFAAYVINKFHALRKNTLDSQTYIVNLNIVIDKEGKVVYYDAYYAKQSDPSDQRNYWTTLYDPNVSSNALMDKIIAKNIVWKPAMHNGKPVNSFVRVNIPGC